MKKLSILFLLSLFIIISCDDATTSPVNNNGDRSLFKISGKVLNPNNRDIPTDAKIVLYSLVQSENNGDYAYTWGEFEFKKSNLSFDVDLSTIPDSLSLTLDGNNSFCVNYLFLVQKDFQTGVWDDEIHAPKLIGAVSSHSIIFTSGDMTNFVEYYPWLNDMAENYNWAEGVYTNEVHDNWIPDSDTDNIELMLEEDQTDDIKIKFPNWK